jgi:hypothetical protein
MTTRSFYARWKPAAQVLVIVVGLALPALRHAAAAPPTLGTVSLTNASMSCVTVLGAVNPNGEDTTVRVQYWVTNQSQFPSDTPALNLGAGLAEVPFEFTLDRLLNTTNYLFHVIAQNSGGAVTSAVMILVKDKPGPSLGAGHALSFNGVDGRVVAGTAMYSNFFSDFTVEFWVNPTEARALTVETNSGISGTNGQRFVIFPTLGGPAYNDVTAAGLGISVGTNGVSVFEYSTNYFPSVLVATNPIIGWTHIALYYTPAPQLYINGGLARTGFSTGKRVRPSLNLGGGTTNFGFFAGQLDEVRVWNPDRAPSSVNTDRDRALPITSGLVGYLRLDEGFGPVSANVVGTPASVVLSNGVSWVPSGVVFWPAAETVSPINVSATGATLRGTVNPNGATNASGQFAWGLTTAYGNTTSFVTVPESWCPQLVEATITNLSPYTIYQFRLTATSSAGSSNSANLAFRTLEAPPVAITVGTTNLTPTNALLQGDAAAFAGTALAWFEWGETTNYTASTAPTPLSGGATQDVNHVLGGLTPGRRYNFRLAVSNMVGLAYGVNRSFTAPIFAALSTALPQTSATLRWVDTDGDSSPDVFLSTFITVNTQQVWRSYHGLFTNATVGFSSGINGSFDWGDYDHDGWPDLMIASFTTNRLWNNNAGTFALASTPFPILSSGVAWGDFDNDGRLDLFLSGTTNGALSGSVCQLWRNNGFGSFTLTNVGLTNLSARGAWGDYDHDGWPDLVLCGLSRANQPVTQIWRNQRTHFTNSAIPLVNESESSAAWGDYDNDGLLDLAVIGSAGGSAAAYFYRNTGAGFETNTLVAIKQLQTGDVAWGDYDNDGLLDLFLAGSTTASSANAVGLVARNIGTNFVDIGTGLPGLYGGSGSWGDYDRDGRIDLLISGNQNGLTRTQIRRNHSSVTNTPPAAPAGLAATVITNGVVQFTWSPGSDAQTPPAGLYYRLRVGTTPGGFDVVSPGTFGDASVTVPLLGALRHTNMAILTGVNTNQVYYWSVQTVDTGLAGSEFSEEGVLFGPPVVVTLPASGVSSNSATLHGAAQPSLIGATAWFELGADTNYGTILGLTNLGSGGAFVPFSEPVTNLTLGATYHFRAVATNVLGTNYGADLTFIPQSPPGADTISAGDYAASVAATLTGGANPGGAPTWVHFEFGFTAAYGGTTALQFIGNGTNTVPVNLLVAGLTPGATYHYRLVASNALGVTYGPDLVFTAPALPPLPNTPPTLTAFTNVLTPTNTPTAALEFAVGDLESNVTNLVMTALAGNTNLVPAANFAFTGDGTNRTLVITPAEDQRGTTAIAVTVSDGFASATQVFILGVGVRPGDLDGDGEVELWELNTVIQAYRRLLP